MLNTHFAFDLNANQQLAQSSNLFYVLLKRNATSVMELYVPRCLAILQSIDLNRYTS